MFLALHFASWITSLEYTSVASSVVLVTTTPLGVALLSPFTLKEPIVPRVWVGMGLALVGGVVVGLSDTCGLESARLICPEWQTFVRGEAFWGDILALFGALMAAAYVLIGRRLRAKLSLVGYVFLVYGAAAYVSITLLGEPIGSTILAYFLLRETPAALKIIGAILILTGIYLASQTEAQNVEQPAG